MFSKRIRKTPLSSTQGCSQTSDTSDTDKLFNTVAKFKKRATRKVFNTGMSSQCQLNETEDGDKELIQIRFHLMWPMQAWER